MFENKRESVTITLTRVDSRAVGTLIALFERAVGLYASLINVNAYHQPGVEAGKKAAAKVLALQESVLNALNKKKQSFSLIDLSRAAGAEAEIETVFKICEHLSANGRSVKKIPGPTSFESSYQAA